VTGTASIAQLTTIDNTNTTGTVTYGTITDTAQNLQTNAGGYVTGHDVIVLDANVSSTSDDLSVAQLSTMDAYAGTLTSVAAIKDTASHLVVDGAATSYITAGTRVTVDGTLTMDELKVITNAVIGNGASDTIGGNATYVFADMAHFLVGSASIGDTVFITGSAQIYRFTGEGDYFGWQNVSVAYSQVNDSATNTAAALAQAGVLNGNVDVTITTAATIAELTTINNSNGSGYLHYTAVNDTAQNISDALHGDFISSAGDSFAQEVNVYVNDTAELALLDLIRLETTGSVTAQAIEDNIDNLMLALNNGYVVGGTEITVFGTANMDQLNQLDAANVLPGISYDTISDTAANLALNVGGFVNNANKVFIQDSASVAELDLINSYINPSKVYGIDESTQYSIRDTYTNLLADGNRANSTNWIANRNIEITSNNVTIAQLAILDTKTTGTITFVDSGRVFDTVANILSDRSTNGGLGTYVTNSLHDVAISANATVSVSQATKLAGIANIETLGSGITLTISDEAGQIYNFVNGDALSILGAGHIAFVVTSMFTQSQIDAFMNVTSDTATYPDGTPTLTFSSSAFSSETLSLNEATWAADHGAQGTLTMYSPVDEGNDPTQAITVAINATTQYTETNLFKALVAAGYKNLIYDATASNAKTGISLNLTGLGSSYTTDRNLKIIGSAYGDTLVGSSGVDTIQGGGGKDIMKGGAGADTFVFSKGDSSAVVTGTTFNGDIIANSTAGTGIDFALGTDKISFTGISVASAHSSTGATNATINSYGIATFNIADNTLLKEVTAVANALGTSAQGMAAEFTFGSDSYVYISDGQNGATVNDVLIKLVGVTGVSHVNLVDANNITLT
jgi:hypothetical protein